jgi:hypothetical protein
MVKKAAPHYGPTDAESKRSWPKTPKIRGSSPQVKASGHKDVHRSRSPMRAGRSSVGQRQRSPSQPKRRSPPKSEARSSRDTVVLKAKSCDDDQHEKRKDKSTDDPWIWKTIDTNWDPIEMSDRELSKLFEERPNTRSFIMYLGKDDLRKEMKVRVNCKFLPIDTKVTFPPRVKKSKKTTMVRYEGRSTWEVVEGRVPAYAFAETFSMAGKVEEMCVCFCRSQG